jgi:hypothetical protein
MDASVGTVGKGSAKGKYISLMEEAIVASYHHHYSNI